MPRAKNAKAEVARKLYEQGILLKDIAEQLDVPQGTIRRWKSTYKWDQAAGCSDVRKESERSDNNERSEKKKVQRVKHDVASVTENPELTDKQRLFCLHYVRCFNSTKAAIKAGYSKNTAMEQGYQLLQKTSVREEIHRLKQSRLNRELLDEHDIFQKYMDIAFADITDFVQFGQEEEYVIGQFGLVQVEDPVTGKKAPLKQKVNTVRFRESDSIDGTLITEVKNGKNGASIKLADRMKALEWLAEHMDIATEEQKARIAVLKMKSAGDEPEDIDTSYVDALKDLAAKVWTNEEEKN